MRKLSLAIFLVALGGAVSVAACGDDETNDNSSTSSTSSSGTGGGGGSTSGTGGGGGSTSGTAGSGGIPSASGFCAWGCTTANDCCFGDPNCPGAYPSNPTCEPGGWCKGAQCSDNTQCTNSGALPDWQCFLLDLGPLGIGDFNACAESCAVDGDCDSPNTTCKGVDQNNAKYCLGDVNPCTGDDQCTGIGTCNIPTGTCVCTDNNQCTFQNVNFCVLP
jgi:hypothetical protein